MHCSYLTFSFCTSLFSNKDTTKPLSTFCETCKEKINLSSLPLLDIVDVERDWHQVHKFTEGGHTDTRRTASTPLTCRARTTRVPVTSQLCVLTGTLLPSTGLAAHHSKTNQEARLVEEKPALFWMPDWMGRVGVCPKSYCPLLTIRGQELFRLREGATCRNSTVSSDSHPETGHRWLDQHHLGFTYSQASVPWLVCSHFLEASPRNCSSSCLGYSLLIL